MKVLITEISSIINSTFDCPFHSFRDNFPAILNVFPAEFSVIVISEISLEIDASGMNFLNVISECISSEIIIILLIT